MTSMLRASGVLCLFAFVAAAGAAPNAEVVLDGLENPCGVAVQSSTEHVFVSDSGAGRILRVVDGKPQDVVVGFPLDVYGEGPEYKIGPLGLAFLDKDTLIVGGGGNKDAEEIVRLYKIPEAGAPPLTADDMAVTLGPLAVDEQRPAEGNFFGVATNRAAIFVTCNGDDAKGWIARAGVIGGKPGKLTRFIATKEAVGVDAPVAITIGPRGEIVVGQMGEIGPDLDSQLSFYNIAGRLVLNLDCGLSDVTALAYSPQGLLYALDFSWARPEEAGLFRLDAARKDGKLAVKTVRIMSLERPTAMAFGKDGHLYITVFGKASDEANDAKSGKLLRVAPGL